MKKNKKDTVAVAAADIVTQFSYARRSGCKRLKGLVTIHRVCCSLAYSSSLNDPLLLLLLYFFPLVTNHSTDGAAATV